MRSGTVMHVRTYTQLTISTREHLCCVLMHKLQTTKRLELAARGGACNGGKITLYRKFARKYGWGGRNSEQGITARQYGMLNVILAPCDNSR